MPRYTTPPTPLLHQPTAITMAIEARIAMAMLRITIAGNLDLETLALSENQVSGSLPDGLCKLVKLKTLYLFSNKFEGAIPTS